MFTVVLTFPPQGGAKRQRPLLSFDAVVRFSHFEITSMYLLGRRARRFRPFPYACRTDFGLGSESRKVEGRYRGSVLLVSSSTTSYLLLLLSHYHSMDCLSPFVKVQGKALRVLRAPFSLSLSLELGSMTSFHILYFVDEPTNTCRQRAVAASSHLFLHNSGLHSRGKRCPLQFRRLVRIHRVLPSKYLVYQNKREQ